MGAEQNSPGSDLTFVSMTTLGGPLCGLSWGFPSRVMSFLCYHKAFLHKDRWNSARGLFDGPIIVLLWAGERDS